MKTIAFASGKGGAGKTSISVSFHKFVKTDSVFADCDVDAADAFLILEKNITQRKLFSAGWKYKINQDACINCGSCYRYCRFSAIKHNDSYSIEPLSCEGCGTCEEVCPVNALEKKENQCGEVFICKTVFDSDMVYARLVPGEDNSGKLVFEVKNTLSSLPATAGVKYSILDCPPGIGCPLIASLTNIDHLVTVIECSKSGFNDAVRLINVANEMKIPVIAIMNKSGINDSVDKMIEDFLLQKNIFLAGNIPFSREVVSSLNRRELIIDNEILRNDLEEIFLKIKRIVLES